MKFFGGVVSDSRTIDYILVVIRIRVWIRDSKIRIQKFFIV